MWVALNNDDCLKDKLDKLALRRVEETERRRAAGNPNLFTGHMFDGSNLSLQENLDISAKLLPLRRRDESIHPGPSIACGPKDDEADGDRKRIASDQRRAWCMSRPGCGGERRPRAPPSFPPTAN